jgi:hypothetical protein
LVVFDHRRQAATVREFSEDLFDAALRARFATEQRYANTPSVEVVLLSADSREELARTHGRYFRTLAELSQEPPELSSVG